MQKWEYIQLQVGYTSEGLARLIHKDGKQVYADRNGMLLTEYLNKLGRDGWELVNIVDNTVFYLKRPIE